MLSLIGGSSLEDKFANSMSIAIHVHLAIIGTVTILFVLVVFHFTIVSSLPGDLEWLDHIQHQLSLLVNSEESLQLGRQFHLVFFVFVQHDVLEVEDLGGGLGWNVS